MKQQIFLLMLSASLAFTSCTKNDDPKPEESNTVEIGGTTYSTVKIGSQTWTTVNYNGASGANYNNGANDLKYGKLYTWAEAKAITVPTGWRLPSKADFDKLLVGLGAVQGTSTFLDLDKTNSLKLMSTSGWSFLQGNNQTALNIYPAGLYDSVNSGYDSKGTVAEFWSGTAVAESNGMFSWSLGVWQEMDGNVVDLEAGTDHSRPNDRLSIRFVKDN